MVTANSEGPKSLPNQTSNGAGNLPPNFLSWHYTWALPQFINSRAKQLASTPKYFNIAGLLKNFFAPYRRLAVTGKTSRFGASTLFDKITFNLTSIFVGASVRLIFLAVWILATILLAILDIFLVLIWLAIPLFSLGQYLDLKNNTFFESDLKNPQFFLKKLAKTKFFNLLTIFFDTDFPSVFNNLQEPQTLGLSSSQKIPQMLLVLFQNWPPAKTYLEQKNIKQKEFELLLSYLANHLETAQKSGLSIGQALSFGYTRILDQYAVELTSLRLASPSKKRVLMQIEKVLTRPNNNNVILVGEPGVGRHNTLAELAAAIVRLQLPTLVARRVMLLDSVSLASSGENLAETKRAFETAFAEAKEAGNIILAIDHIDRLASPKEGRIDITDVLTTILTDNQLPIIGITTPDEFNQFIRPNGNFASLFERVDIEEASTEETISILVGKALETFPKEKIKVNLDAIIEIAQKSKRLVLDRKQPEKSIILLEDAIAEAKTRSQQTINVALVDEIISLKTKTPIGTISLPEAQKLKNLEDLLHQRIIGQNQAIDAIARAMRRARAEIEAGTRPIGSFLFLGPTGVGKTETAKALAASYFGSEEKMVRLDMSEFQEDNALERLIGDINTQRPGQLASLIRENPYGLLLVDEFEKANRTVHNLFLQVLDEGFLTDAFGKKVSFDNIIIIATSNAGAEFIREQLAKQVNSLQLTRFAREARRAVHSENNSVNPALPAGRLEPLTTKLIDYILKQGLFTPELINRFDAVVVYHPLGGQEVIKVTTLMLAKLAQQLKETKNITLEISPQLAQIIAQKGFDPVFGARPIRRLIADKLEDGIAKMIISNQVRNGDTIPATTLLKFVT